MTNRGADAVNFAHMSGNEGRRVPELVESPPDLEQLYRTYRRYALTVAYRMLGSITDAEDIVQDWFSEMHGRPLSGIRDVKAYIAKSITNRCLNLMQSASRRRETYVGEWLPEPLPDTYGVQVDGPYEAAERADNLSYALLVMLERLTPAERAVFLLREVFEYEYELIAEAVGKSEAACRKILSRAKQNLSPEASCPVPPATSPGSRATLMNRFAAAIQHYDIGEMLTLLTQDAVLITDGGGRVRSAINPIISRERVVALLSSQRAFKKLRIWDIRQVTMNGELCLIYHAEHTVKAVITAQLSPEGDRIQRVFIVLNPDKLGHIYCGDGQ
ncbi:sigma-70 family RNA polymerase sigma factor [Paenibacillus sp. YPG26]|uniref:sigma-70 family RNA polymerase sigma factor n=1 Tax=Paenibacillus sp. YPG26 TaxID=2878915 RepID=UPI00203E0D90|nr:sigma-70 family RNA polymerase sigma factor [Paenibacillus sp. YPG26]USB33066.1 sigma-70 family RNA polymerase sigma factor [Paenibacillus sp. YPG26]